MAQVGHETVSGPVIDRRTINMVLGFGAVAGVIGGGIVAFEKISKGDEPQETDSSSELSSDLSLSAYDARTNIQGFMTIQDRYRQNPWANPEDSADMSPEEIEESSSIYGELTDEELVEQIRRQIERAKNIARTQTNFENARDLNYAVGEKNSAGEDTSNYGEYAKEELIDPLLDGTFAAGHSGQEADNNYSVNNEKFASQLSEYAAEFEEYALVDLNYRNVAIVKVAADLMPSNTAGDSLHIRLTTSRTDPKDYTKEIVETESITVDRVGMIGNKNILGLQDIKLTNS